MGALSDFRGVLKPPIMKIYTCTNFHKYLSLLPPLRFPDLVTGEFPHFCRKGGKNAEVAAEWVQQAHLDQGENIVVCGRFCPLASVLPPASGSLDIVLQDQCFYTIANRNSIDFLVREGYYLVTEPWLRSWRERLSDLGFSDRDLARSFFARSAAKIVCLSLNEKRESTDLEDFARFVALDFVVFPVSTEYMAFFVSRLIADWELRHSDGKPKEEVVLYRRQIADYAMLFDLMGRLSTCDTERDAVNGIEEALRLLFAAGLVRYYPVRCGDPSVNELDPTLRSFLCESTAPSIEKGNGADAGFLLRIDHGGETLGVLESGQFALPRYAHRYLTFMINIANVLGLAISNARKIERIRRQEAHLREISTHDSLTGLFNRRYFEDALHSLRTSDDAFPACLVMCDMDGLKAINDILGHEAGDAALIELADALRSAFRSCDTVCRLGGDEFAAIVPKCPEDYPARIRERIERAIQETNGKEGRTYTLSASLGFAMLLSRDMDPERVLADADAAMYREKAGKKLKR